MSMLRGNWITEGLIDFEYKKYILLAYLKKIDAHFKQKKLYPVLSDLTHHYHHLLLLKKYKDDMHARFPRFLSEVDLEKFALTYEKVMKDDELMQEIENIMHFAIPKIREALNKGKALHEDIEKSMDLFPIGIVPLYNKEGYLLIRPFGQRQVYIYAYKSMHLYQHDERCLGVHMEHVDTRTCSLTATLESMKMTLVRTHKKKKNPATFAVISKHHYPFSETILPIIQRMLMHKIFS